jgi:hypothetical protein
VDRTVVHQVAVDSKKVLHRFICHQQRPSRVGNIRRVLLLVVLQQHPVVVVVSNRNYSMCLVFSSHQRDRSSSNDITLAAIGYISCTYCDEVFPSFILPYIYL